jgi:hypothetical protein
MPTRSPQDVPAETIGELGLPPRAVTVLTRAGVTRTADLAVLTRRELAAIGGLGPGLIAAIRAVVPEPAGAAPSAPETEVDSPLAPPIPSFESLRGPRRSSALDLLVPAPAPEPEQPSAQAPRPDPAPRPAAPRPPEYADLWRLGVHLARAAACVPVRVLRWSVTGPLRRLLGAGDGDSPQV